MQIDMLGLHWAGEGMSNVYQKPDNQPVYLGTYQSFDTQSHFSFLVYIYSVEITHGWFVLENHICRHKGKRPSLSPPYPESSNLQACIEFQSISAMYTGEKEF
jgi:hypothetical protein